MPKRLTAGKLQRKNLQGGSILAVSNSTSNQLRNRETKHCNLKLTQISYETWLDSRYTTELETTLQSFSSDQKLKNSAISNILKKRIKTNTSTCISCNIGSGGDWFAK